MNHSIAVSTGTYSIPVAIQYKSTDVAICVQFFVNMITRHKLAGRNFVEGRTWNYCTLEKLQEYFPFWTPKMIRTRVKELVTLGILIVGNFNDKRYDRTLWYAFADEVKFGVAGIEPICPNGQMDLPNQANGFAQEGRPIPLTKTTTNSSVFEVNDTASPSLTSSINDKRSLYKGKARYSQEQLDSLHWLKSLNLDTSEATLSWWARTYPLSRLDEVHREAVKRKPKSLGAYMQRLLKQGSVVVSGRVELNAEFAQCFKALRNWNSLEIHQKYASINRGNHNIEIDFNMEPEAFRDYLEQKYETFEGTNG